MALRTKDNIIPTLFGLANGTIKPKAVDVVKIEKKKTPQEILKDIIGERPKVKVVRKYFKDQVDVINENVDQQFYEDII